MSTRMRRSFVWLWILVCAGVPLSGMNAETLDRWRVVAVTGEVEVLRDPFHGWSSLDATKRLPEGCLVRVRKGSLKLERESYSVVAGANSVLKLSDDERPALVQRWGTVLYEAAAHAAPLEIAAPLVRAFAQDGSALVSVQKNSVSVTAGEGPVALEYGWLHERLQLDKGESVSLDERGRRLDGRSHDKAAREIEEIVRQHERVLERKSTEAALAEVRGERQTEARQVRNSRRLQKESLELPRAPRWPESNSRLLAFENNVDDDYEQHVDERANDGRKEDDGGTEPDDGADDDHGGGSDDDGLDDDDNDSDGGHHDGGDDDSDDDSHGDPGDDDDDRDRDRDDE